MKEFYDWENEDVHKGEAQQSSMAKAAKLKPSKIDHENKTAEFIRTSASSYHTTLNTCVCGSESNGFKECGSKTRPCKHMYRLAAELEYAGFSMQVLNEAAEKAAEEEKVQAFVKTIIDADNKNLDFDAENKIAHFRGSNGEYYETTLEYCTCAGFFHGAYCKHMRWLALKLKGII